MAARKLSWRHWLSCMPGAGAAWSLGRRLGEWTSYMRDFARFAALANAAGRDKPRWQDRFPCLGQKTNRAEFDRHYVYHVSWAGRVLARTRPARHVDISSSLYFVGVVSAFVPVEHYDYRPPDLKLDNLRTGFADLVRLPFADGSLSSLSCLHVVEHVGLGRYGDPLDPNGDLKAIGELKRVLARNGSLLFVVPVGQARIQFNSHRIYSFAQVLNYFPGLTLKEFALIPDGPADVGLVYSATQEMADAQRYGCGCFWFTGGG